MYHEFKKGRNLLIVGFGGIAQAFLPLLFRHLKITGEQVRAVDPKMPLESRQIASEFGVTVDQLAITPDNFEDYLKNHLKSGDYLLNLSVNVSSIALVEWCFKNGVLYQDTCIEPWAGGYTDTSVSHSQRSNYALREQALSLGDKLGSKGPTIILTNGANPGLVSYLTKEALLQLRSDLCAEKKEHLTAADTLLPKSKQEWAKLASDLGVKVIHVAERDTQKSRITKEKDVFVNTWSCDGFIGEGSQPSELGWGSHEKTFPAFARRHSFGRDSAVYLLKPGAAVRVRTYTPCEGATIGYLITHGESISISDFYTLKDTNGKVVYRPTVHYAYHPCDDAVLSLHELAEKDFRPQKCQRLLGADDIIDGGLDELGILLLGHAKKAFWFGSLLSIDEAKALVPHNNATALQVTATILAGMVFSLENPGLGIVEPDDIPYDKMLAVARPYLGKVYGAYSDWTPLRDRSNLFPQDVDQTCPWQFGNFLVD